MTSNLDPREGVLTRVLLITGKGGVGKTTVAAATAVHAAAAGARVLVTSTDPAHSLADALAHPVGDTPTPVLLPSHGAGYLAAQQLDALGRLERSWDRLRGYLVELLAWGGLGEVEAEELLLPPGVAELLALLELRTRMCSDTLDLLVVDCAPTAETLQLLTLPETLRWYADRVLGPARRLRRGVAPIERVLVPGSPPLPLPDDAVLDQAGRLHEDLAAIHDVLRDPRRSSVRLVLVPERLAVAEARRTATSLALFGYALDAVVANRVLPSSVTDPFLARWLVSQTAHLAEVDDSFHPVPVLTAAHHPEEPIGTAALAELGAALYDDRDPVARYVDQPLMQLDLDQEPYRLRLALPFTGADDLELGQRGTELTVTVAGRRRMVALPAALARREVAGARMRDGWLELSFAPEPVAVAP